MADTGQLMMPTLEEARARLPQLVKGRVGQGAFVSEDLRDAGGGSFVARIGITRPHTVSDPTSDEAIIRFLRYPDVAVASLKKTRSGIEIRLPSPEDMFEKAEHEEDTLIYRVEVAILDSTRARVAQSPIIQNAMNPIKEILVNVAERETMTRAQLKANERYVPFLRDLRYLDVQGDHVRPGPMLLQMEASGLSDPYVRIMGDIIAEGYDYLTQELRVRHIVPFVRTANAYFWPSFNVGRPLAFRLKDFESSLKRVYRSYRLSALKLANHVQELTECGVLVKEGSTRTADEGVWSTFEQKVPLAA